MMETWWLPHRGRGSRRRKPNQWLLCPGSVGGCGRVGLRIPFVCHCWARGLCRPGVQGPASRWFCRSGVARAGPWPAAFLERDDRHGRACSVCLPPPRACPAGAEGTRGQGSLPGLRREQGRQHSGRGGARGRAAATAEGGREVGQVDRQPGSDTAVVPAGPGAAASGGRGGMSFPGSGDTVPAQSPQPCGAKSPALWGPGPTPCSLSTRGGGG